MPELDCLRGLAIAMVLLFHGFASRYSTEGLSGIPRLFVQMVSPGWAGVNLFFALSGFLITGILLDSQHQARYYRNFYVRRALRILPAYYALLVLLALLGRHGILDQKFSWAFLGMSVIYLSNMSPLLGVPMQFGVLWSLSVEEHFYLFWPLVVRNVSRNIVGIMAVLITVGASFARVAAFWLGYDYFGHYTWLVADALALGALLAVLARGSFGTRWGMTIVALVAFLGGILLVLIGHLFHPALAGGSLDITALNLLCTAVVALSLVLGTGPWNVLFQNRPLKFLGEISYGLYLIHMLVFNVFDNLQEHFFPHTPTFKGRIDVMVVRFITCGAIAIAVATLSRRFFEEPFLRLKDRFTGLRGERDDPKKIFVAKMGEVAATGTGQEGR